MSTTITRGARAVLASDATVCAGSALTISGKLPPREYGEIKRVLEAAGARWDRRAQAHLFSGDAAEALARLLDGDRVTSSKQADQWFATPPAVVAQLLDLAHLKPGMRVLEPSAGEGAIADAVTSRGCYVDCVELSEQRAQFLKDASNAVCSVFCGDFLTVAPHADYDRVIMNPPFTRLQDTRHVLHALKFVRPGGLLVSVMGNGVTHRSDSGSMQIRDAAKRPGGAIIELAPGAFADSGTNIATVIVVLTVPGAGQAKKADAPVRVTVDKTSEGLPLFNAATAKPGVYVHYDSWGGTDAVFRFAGNCVGCGVKTWQHDKGGDDIRGAFGDHTCVAITDEDLRSEVDGDVPEGTRFPRCSLCWNEYDRYRKALDEAVRLFREQHQAQQAPATLF